MGNSKCVLVKKWHAAVFAAAFLWPGAVSLAGTFPDTENSVDFKNVTCITQSMSHFGVNFIDGLERTTKTPSDQNKRMSNIERKMIEDTNSKQLHSMMPSFAFICALLAFGLPSNIFAIFIYVTKLKKAVARHFIITLAVSDLLTCLIAMPSELDIMTRYFDFDEDAYCKFFRFTAYFTNNVSSVTLVAIAIERHRIICTPWKQRFTARISKNICYIIIISSALYALPMVFMYGTHVVYLGKASLNLTEVYKNQSFSVSNVTDVFNATYKPAFSLSSVTDDLNATYNTFDTFLITGKTCSISDTVISSTFPFITVMVYIITTVIVYLLLSILYGRIGRSLYIRRRDSVCQQNQKLSSRHVRQVTVMGFTLTVVYQICYLPCLILVVLRLARPTFYASLSIGGKMLYNVLLKSYLINCSVNPFIYCIFNKTVQKMFLKKCTVFKRESVSSKESFQGSENPS